MAYIVSYKVTVAMAVLAMLLAISSVQGARVLKGDGFDADVDLSSDPSNPGGQYTVGFDGNLVSYENGGALYLNNEDNGDGTGGNYGITYGYGNALALGTQPNANVQMDYSRNEGNNINRIAVLSTATSSDPVYTYTDANAGGSELALNMQENDGPASLAFSTGQAQAYSEQNGENSGSLAGYASDTDAGPGFAVQGQETAAYIAAINPAPGTTNTQANSFGASIVAENLEGLTTQLGPVITELFNFYQAAAVDGN